MASPPRFCDCITGLPAAIAPDDVWRKLPGQLFMEQNAARSTHIGSNLRIRRAARSNRAVRAVRFYGADRRRDRFGGHRSFIEVLGDAALDNGHGAVAGARKEAEVVKNTRLRSRDREERGNLDSLSLFSAIRNSRLSPAAIRLATSGARSARSNLVPPFPRSRRGDN